MNKYISSALALGIVLMGASCSKEHPWDLSESNGQGRLLKSAIELDLQNQEGIEMHTRAAAPAHEDFTLDFIKDGETTPTVSYKYSEMPEVVMLDAGVYTAVASHGENPHADWEAPYFKGETKFNIVADKITEHIDPIVAKLSNVRVSILFDPALKAAMGADSKVTVRVGEHGTLDFSHTDADRSGYFAHVENSQTLTATFNGTVDGYPVSESKGYDNVQPGTHYRITFKLHNAASGGDGNIAGNITVDASVEVTDMNVSVDPEDETLVDDMRPVQGGDTPGPVTPVDPVNPAPTITSVAPNPADPDDAPYIGFKPVDLSIENVTASDLYVCLNVESTAPGGIQAFKVYIDSDSLTPDELEGVGLQQELDLVNPGDLEDSLVGLGFPVNVGGKSSCKFQITGFIPMLNALGEAKHKFTLVVTDANGTTTVELKLRTL